MQQTNVESENFDDFCKVTNVDAKFIVPRIIRLLVREVRKNNLDYGTLRYIYRRVRDKCDLIQPRKPKKLYQLPTKDELIKFFSVIDDPVHKLVFEFLIGTWEAVYS